MNQHASLTISRAAAAAGVNVETIRYYQRRGLLAEPDKPSGGFRRYSEADVLRLRFIKRAQQLGFTLEEITGLLQLEDGQDCGATRRLAEHKLVLIRRRLDDLNRMRCVLEDLTARCASGGRPRSCPIIAALEGQEPVLDNRPTLATTKGVR